MFFSGHKQSLILLYDHLTDSLIRGFEEGLHEVRKYYSPLTVTDLARQLKKGKLGYFSVAFRNARKSVLRWAIPVLDDLSIPATIYLQPNCVGTNQAILGDSTIPISEQDPLSVYTTWKKLSELPRNRFELGIWHSAKVHQDLSYVKTQWGQAVQTIFDPGGQLPSNELSVSSQLECVLTENIGIVEKQTDPLRLPRFILEKIIE